jgi:hypothetical protein
VTKLECGFKASLFYAGDELVISATYNNRIAGARALLDRLLRRTVMPKLLYNEPRNVWPAVVIVVATIVLTVAALAIELGGLEKTVIFAIGFSVAGALVLLMLRSTATGPGGTGRRIGASLLVIVVGLAFCRQGCCWPTRSVSGCP